MMLAGGAAALFVRGRTSSLVGAAGAVLGGAVACVPAVAVLLSGRACELRLPWSMPYGSFYVAIDALSAFFLLPILIIPALAAVYGVGYLEHWESRRRLGICWFFYNVLAAGMALVVVARNGMLFLVAWEIMTLASWFLVTLDDEKQSVRDAGWVYLVASHVGAAFLLVFFAMLGRGSASLDFDQMHGAAGATANVLFVMAVLGFGTKAGFIPLHVWLPEAHPAAPSHVSAVMSGVMIKTGIYGIVRALMLLGAPQAWWGYALVGIGITSGILGVLFAIAQHDLKRLLAYHSVENIGIIAIGIGLGVIGVANHQPAIAVLGFAGGLFHVMNHATFKALLFLGAGSVQHAAHTLEIDRLGGLLRRMPWTGVSFLVGAVAISGLPPLNGFASELLAYLGALEAIGSPRAIICIGGVAAIGALALIGGLAAACFAKAFGIVFLGEPRREETAGAHESGWAMRLPMIALASLCVVLGLGSIGSTRLLRHVLADVTGMESRVIAANVQSAVAVQIAVASIAAVLIAMVCLLIALRRGLLAGRSVRRSVTWDCGYAAPTARMQYTASSFAQPITTLFGAVLRTHNRVSRPTGTLPREASMESHTGDLFRERAFAPLFRGVESVVARLRWLQHGHLHLYVLYIALTLLALIVWKLGAGQ